MGSNGWWQRFTGRFRRGTGGGQPPLEKDVVAQNQSQLEAFVASRRGVEVFVEAPTNLNRPSVLLIAHDGESVRRSVPSVRWGHDFAKRRDLPSYDAGVVGYPQRMRDYNRRRR
ncbi:hypothetical protein ACQBAU_05885 [Propionibacteriaceae bacterium Y2011]|uniref:hypothetical protein n=1 Tax=Microlunatus sp. Y2014 TaxID=3418488 RepID=UPI003B43F376